ncbi:AIPR family protein [Gemella sanguinis]|uniref:AIPR family protein n=1 Tax=Gemella sanguinis TaxID=84135 RepID=UPI00352E7AD8
MVEVNTNEIQNTLKEEMKRLSIHGRSESKQLILWALIYMYEIDKSLAETLICDGSQDKGIDAIFVDDHEMRILVFQGKYKQNNNATFGDTDLQRLKGASVYFENEENIQNLLNSNANAEVKSLVKEYDIINKVSDYSVEMHFISNALPTKEANEYKENFDNLYFCDINFMKDSYKYIKKEPLVLGEKTFTDISNSILEDIDTTKGIKSLFVVLPASQLIELGGLGDLTLFNKNVRSGLGNTRVNKSIRKTINNPNENKYFPIFHNGISIVCENMTLDKENLTLKIENYSVVNGAQSILSFKAEEKNINSNIRTLVKFSTVGNDSTLTELISTYNNNQNAISLKDLRSSDSVQLRLKREFEDLNSKYKLNYSYLSKAGETVTQSVIDNGLAAQLIMSGYRFKPYLTHLKTSMFDQRYSEVFNRNTKASDILKYYDVYTAVNKVGNVIENEGVSKYGLAKFTVVAILCKYIKKSSILMGYWTDINIYIQYRENWEGVYTYFIKLIWKLIKRALNKKEKEEEFTYKNYFKNEKDIDALMDDVIEELDVQFDIAEKDITKLVSDYFGQV